MNPTNIKAVLFRSKERFSSFQKKLDEYGVHYKILDFEGHEWLEFDYSNIDFVIYYPSFKYSANHPLALHEVYDNLTFIHTSYPQIKMFPDPNIIQYYNDKYRQYLFLKARNYPMPHTIPLLSDESIALADEALGYPMVIKNRFGAGGDSVYRVFSKKELRNYYNLSRLNLFNLGSARYLLGLFSKRIFYYHLIKEKRAPYPFMSPPLLAQKFIKLDRDLKIVVGNDRVVEGHWRGKASEEMWKVNIDGGGIGEWSKIPEQAMDLSLRLAQDLKTLWLNIDFIMNGGEYLITEFSPVWHHYAYKEKPTFVYKDDYNIDIPLEVSLDLERMIVESLLNGRKK
jgi:glutathione synthase/RimK-type ligase-like ATP-grasp enzyme